MCDLSTLAGLHRPQHGGVCRFRFHRALLPPGGLRHQEHTAGQLHPEGKLTLLLQPEKTHLTRSETYLFRGLVPVNHQLYCNFDLVVDAFPAPVKISDIRSVLLGDKRLYLSGWRVKLAPKRHQEPRKSPAQRKEPRKSRADLSSNCSGRRLPDRTTRRFRLLGLSQQLQQFTNCCLTGWVLGRLGCGSCTVGLGQERTYSGNEAHSCTRVENCFTASDKRRDDTSFKYFIFLFRFLFSEGDHRDDPPVRRSVL